jgi:hypothetical protein
MEDVCSPNLDNDVPVSVNVDGMTKPQCCGLCRPNGERKKKQTCQKRTEKKVM